MSANGTRIVAAAGGVAATVSPAVFHGPGELRAAVSQRFGPTTWLRVGRARVDRFLAATTLAVTGRSADASAARRGVDVVPEMLVLSLSNYVLPQLVEVRDVVAGVNYGTGEVRFPNPLPVGGRLRGRAEVLDVVDVPGGVQSTVRVVLETDAGVAARGSRRLRRRHHQPLHRVGTESPAIVLRQSAARRQASGT